MVHLGQGDPSFEVRKEGRKEQGQVLPCSLACLLGGREEGLNFICDPPASKWLPSLSRPYSIRIVKTKRNFRPTALGLRRVLFLLLRSSLKGHPCMTSAKCLTSLNPSALLISALHSYVLCISFGPIGPSPSVPTSYRDGP